MPIARRALAELGFDEVGSYVNSGNLMFTAGGKASVHQAAIRAALEAEFGFELTTFVRTSSQVKALSTAEPFGKIAAGRTHFALLTLRPLSDTEKRTVESLSNEHDEVLVLGRDVHWLIRSRSTETTLGPRQWLRALPDNPTTAPEHDDAGQVGSHPLMDRGAALRSSGEGKVRRCPIRDRQCRPDFRPDRGSGRR